MKKKIIYKGYQPKAPRQSVAIKPPPKGGSGSARRPKKQLECRQCGFDMVPELYEGPCVKCLQNEIDRLEEMLDSANYELCER